MPLQQVYGKKAVKAAFSVSDIFTESSPLRTDSRPAAQHDEDVTSIDGTTRAFRGLKIDNVDLGARQATRARKALSKRDVNSEKTGRSAGCRKKRRDLAHGQEDNLQSLEGESLAEGKDNLPHRAKARTATVEVQEEKQIFKDDTASSSSSSPPGHRSVRAGTRRQRRVIDEGSEDLAGTKNTECSCPTSPAPRRSPRKHIAGRTRELDLCDSRADTAKECDDYVRALTALTNQQRAPIEFVKWSDTLSPHFVVSKIAEASYSEVYRLSLKSSSTPYGTSDESVLKLIALKPPPNPSMKKTKTQMKKEDNMSAVEDVASEVKLLERMAGVPGFTNFRALHVIRGRPSKVFCDAWKAWNKGRAKDNKSTFADPSRKTSYGDEQYWAVLEMQDAGMDVEQMLEDEEMGTQMRQIWGVWDIFWQTVLAIAKGENEARFEHRDLHLGNICVRRKVEKHVGAYVDNKKFGFVNLEATIIDYTLSRADMQSSSRPLSWHSSSSDSTTQSSSTLSRRSFDEVEVAYNPLQNQQCIFEGDAEDDYQYEIYRYMRQTVTSPHPEDELSTREEDLVWKSFNPVTNLLWLHFILDRMCETLQWPSDDEELRGKTLEKALELELVLRQVSTVLEPKTLRRKNGENCLVSSAAELVGLAVVEGWLAQEDIEA